jgi:hypothetical protein
MPWVLGNGLRPFVLSIETAQFFGF